VKNTDYEQNAAACWASIQNLELSTWRTPLGVSGYMTRPGTILQAVMTFSCYETFAKKLITVESESILLVISCLEKWNQDSGRNKFRLLGLMDEREVLLCFDNYHDYHIVHGNGPTGGMKKHRAISMATYFRSLYSPPDED